MNRAPAALLASACQIRFAENYSPEEARNPAGVSQLRPLNNSSPGTLQDSFLFILLLVGLLVHCALIPLVRVGLIRL